MKMYENDLSELTIRLPWNAYAKVHHDITSAGLTIFTTYCPLSIQVSMRIAYLVSYEHQGQLRIECVSGCK